MNEHSPRHDYQPQTELLEHLLQPQPTVIGIEGGPCSGKTTLLNEVARQAVQMDRTVAVLPEAASEHIARLHAEGRNVGELAANNRPAYLAFQKDIMRTIVDNIREAQQQHAGTDAVIVADRADIGAYVTAAEHREIYGSIGLAKPPIHTLVDQLIFMPSVACEEQPDLYGRLRLNNDARLEATSDEAARVSNANLRAVRAHPELHVDWGGNFEAKIRRLAALVLQPEIEGEIKFEADRCEADELLIRRNAASWLSQKDITQSYHRVDGQAFRLRESYEVHKEDYGDFFFTVKTGEGAFRREIQRRLTQSEYILLKATPREGNELHKRRFSVLDGPDETGHQRQWFGDEYSAPLIAERYLETAVHDQAEYDKVAKQYRWLGMCTTKSAKSLIFK